MDIETKYLKLKRIIRDIGSLLVAFSGGVDSTLLLKVAFDELKESAAAITVDTPFHSRFETEEAARLANLIGVRQILLKIPFDAVNGIDFNPQHRCYLCKKKLFSLCLDSAKKSGFATLADGSNIDDASDYRPGRKALAELAVRSPLYEAGLSKDDIRQLSRKLGLDTWDKPALACLLTRFPHGEQITESRLAMVEQSEDFLRSKGFKQLRVRSIGDAARIELANDEIALITEHDIRLSVINFFHQKGFASVSVDLAGYRCGSMNIQPAG